MLHKKRIIEVVEYDPQWSEIYRQEANILKEIMHNELVAIHHIGSTAIPGLKAKPIIDILLEVKSIEALDNYEDRMRKIGYFARGELGIPGRRFYLKGLYKRTHHIHAYNAGSPHIKRHLAFRDYLRENTGIALKYEKLKERCADTCGNDNEKYCDCKHEFVQKHEKLALQWLENEQRK